jgi:molybdenum cofactor biosynthesis protein B
MSHLQHQSDAGSLAARCAIVTLSDTRTFETDTSGSIIESLLHTAGHLVVERRLIKDEPTELLALLGSFPDRSDIDVILTTGGTGISRRDCTISVVEPLLTTPLPGFGELFRMLSYEQIGSSAMLSRALGGVMEAQLVFCMPGSSKAVELAMQKLILPELRHLLHQLRK